ncbi:MAG: ABC transporter substrate-binding protein [Methanomicrobium sp.]|nr:ABC transporter substrate-binding protein [Methanomicrobium sp.]
MDFRPFKLPVQISVSTVIFVIIILSGLSYLYLYNFGPAPDNYPDEIKIGAILPLSGSMKTYGIEIQQGIEMAVEDLNSAGGIRGKKIKVEYFDNIGSENLAVFGFKKFADDNIPVIIGPVSSNIALVLSPLAEELKTVLISPTATNPGLSDYKNYVFRTISSDIYQGKGIAKVLPTLHPEIKTASVIYINTDYGTGLKDSFEDWFPKTGRDVVLSESYEQGETDYFSLLKKVKEAHSDAVVLIGTVEDATTILKNADEMNLDTVWFCSEGLINEEIPESVGEYSEGICALMQSSQIQSKEFIRRYKQRYNKTVDWPVTYGYDTTMVIAEALSASDYSGESISKALKYIRHLGLCGPKVFDENGDIPPAYDIMRIENGSWVRVKWNQVVFVDDSYEENSSNENH